MLFMNGAAHGQVEGTKAGAPFSALAGHGWAWMPPQAPAVKGPPRALSAAGGLQK